MLSGVSIVRCICQLLVDLVPDAGHMQTFIQTCAKLLVTGRNTNDKKSFSSCWSIYVQKRKCGDCPSEWIMLVIVFSHWEGNVFILISQMQKCLFSILHSHSDKTRNCCKESKMHLFAFPFLFSVSSLVGPLSPDVPKATWLWISTVIHTETKVNPVNLHRTQRKVFDYCHGNTPRRFGWICQTFIAKLKSYLLMSRGTFPLTVATPLNSNSCQWKQHKSVPPSLIDTW